MSSDKKIEPKYLRARDRVRLVGHAEGDPFTLEATITAVDTDDTLSTSVTGWIDFSSIAEAYLIDRPGSTVGKRYKFTLKNSDTAIIGVLAAVTDSPTEIKYYFLQGGLSLSAELVQKIEEL